MADPHVLGKVCSYSPVSRAIALRVQDQQKAWMKAALKTGAQKEHQISIRLFGLFRESGQNLIRVRLREQNGMRRDSSGLLTS